jgi:2-methylisocitrate lyase-like PEP mutase family enzyme
MATRLEKTERFRALHHGDTPLLVPNPWGAGSAKVFAELGFDALATTSSGFAGTLGRLDGFVSREEALAHAAAIAAASDLPVTADLENGYGHDPSEVAETMLLAAETGIAGCSVEDYAGRDSDEIYDAAHATERIAAAAEVARREQTRIVLTARAENFLHGRPDLADTIARLQSFQAAGADVVYAPGVSDLEDIRRIVESVDVPVNVLALPNAPNVAQLAAIGVGRVSVGGAFSYVAIGAAAEAARELKEQGTYSFWNAAGSGARIARRAWGH